MHGTGYRVLATLHDAIVDVDVRGQAQLDGRLLGRCFLDRVSGFCDSSLHPTLLLKLTPRKATHSSDCGLLSACDTLHPSLLLNLTPRKATHSSDCGLLSACDPRGPAWLLHRTTLCRVPGVVGVPAHSARAPQKSSYYKSCVHQHSTDMLLLAAEDEGGSSQAGP